MKVNILSRVPVAVIFVLLSLIYLPSVEILHEPYCAAVKVLPLLLLIAAVKANMANSSDPTAHKLAILSLVFSMGGDIAGDFKAVIGDSAFLVQIGLFAMAQFVLAASFSRYNRKREFGPDVKEIAGIVSRILLLAYLVFFGSFLMKHITGPLFFAVGIYMTLIASMFLTCTMQDRRGYMWFLTGAGFFIISDSAIAYDAFISGFPFRDEIVMYTYFLAQLLLNIQLIAKK